VEIERVPMRALGLLDGSREAVWHVEAPLLDAQWSTTTALLETARRAGARVLLTGHWGDQVLFDQAYLVDLVHRFQFRRVREHLVEFGRWLTDVDPRHFRRRFLLDLVKHSVPAPLLPLLRRLRREPAPPWYAAAFRRRVRRPGFGQQPDAPFVTAHARSLYEQARSGHHVLCLEWNNKAAAMHGLDVAFPFLDRDVLSFLLAVPGEMQAWNGVPKALLRSAMHRVLPEAIVRRTWKADFTDLVNEGLRRELPGVTRYLDADGMAVRLGYVERGALREELARLDDRMDSRSAASAWAVSDLLGLELWLRTFFERGAGRHAPRESGRTAAMLAAGGGA
jgi:asparagine synthetase B (glutamine-hydrolysing)